MEEKKKVKPFFTPEFKADAVKLVNSSSRSVCQIAKELGVCQGALRTWVSKASGDGLSVKLTSPKDQIKQLKKENTELRIKREILKRFAILSG